MRDRMQGPRNTESPVSTGGFTKNTSVGEVGVSQCRISGAPFGLNSSPRTEEVEEMVLDAHEY